MKKKIPHATAVKFCGVLLDAHLSWKLHITELSKKLARTVGVILKLDIKVHSVILCNLWYSCLATDT